MQAAGMVGSWVFRKVLGSAEFREKRLSEEGQGSHCGKTSSWMKQMKQKTNRAQAT